MRPQASHPQASHPRSVRTVPLADLDAWGPGDRLSRRAALAAGAAAALVALGSWGHGSRWESTTTVAKRRRPGRRVVGGGSSEDDGAALWASDTFVLGVVATGAVMAATWLAGRGRPTAWWSRIGAVVAAVVGAACAAGAGTIAYAYWQTLLAQQAAGPVVEAFGREVVTTEFVHVAWGLPIVTAAGAFGAVACLALAALLLADAASNRRPTDSPP